MKAAVALLHRAATHRTRRITRRIQSRVASVAQCEMLAWQIEDRWPRLHACAAVELEGAVRRIELAIGSLKISGLCCSGAVALGLLLQLAFSSALLLTSPDCIGGVIHQLTFDADELLLTLRFALRERLLQLASALHLSLQLLTELLPVALSLRQLFASSQQLLLEVLDAQLIGVELGRLRHWTRSILLQHHLHICHGPLIEELRFSLDGRSG